MEAPGEPGAFAFTRRGYEVKNKIRYNNKVLFEKF